MGAPVVTYYDKNDSALVTDLAYNLMDAGSNDNDPDSADHLPIHVWNDKGGGASSSDMTSITITTLRKLIEDEAMGNSDGTSDQEFTCVNIPIYSNSQLIHASGVLWAEVDDLSGVGIGEYYEFNDTTGVVLFGDGSNGTIPPSGYPITATYQIDTVAAGKEWVDDKWSEVRSIGTAGSGIVDDNESTFTAIGGSTVHSIGDIPSNCARYLYLRVDAPEDATPVGGSIQLRFRVSYAYT